MKFIIDETEKFYVERINIYGNNITKENVIRNQFEIDEGDSFNEILYKKSVNNIKALNFFRNVDSEVLIGKEDNSRIININVQEKPTGEVSAGAGFGTGGSTFLFAVKENNFLGKGIGLNSNFSRLDRINLPLLELANIKSKSKYTIFSADKDKLEKKELNKKKIIKNFFICKLKKLFLN